MVAEADVADPADGLSVEPEWDDDGRQAAPTMITNINAEPNSHERIEDGGCPNRVLTAAKGSDDRLLAGQAHRARLHRARVEEMAG